MIRLLYLDPIGRNREASFQAQFSHFCIYFKPQTRMKLTNFIAPFSFYNVQAAGMYISLIMEHTT